MTSLTESGIKQLNKEEQDKLDKEYKFKNTWYNSMFVGICLVVGLVIILVFQMVSLNQPDVEYISAKEIQSYDHSQLSITDGTSYYSWYDWDRRSGKVYLVTRVNGEVVSVESAYGEDGSLLYIRPEDMEQTHQ